MNPSRVMKMIVSMINPGEDPGRLDITWIALVRYTFHIDLGWDLDQIKLVSICLKS